VSNGVSRTVELSLQIADDINPTTCPEQPVFASWVAAVFEQIELHDERQNQSRRNDARGNLVIRVVAAAESAALNLEFRGKDKPTNVLAFPAGPALIPEHDETEIGDLVLCLEVATREADEQAKSLSQHLAHLTVHGTLHLLGYDHQNDAEAEKMEGLERCILQNLGLPDPY